MASMVIRDDRGRRRPNVTARLRIGVVVALFVIVLGALLQQPRRVYTMITGSWVVATVDSCIAKTVGRGKSGLAQHTTCVGSWRMPDGQDGSGPLDGVGDIRSYDGNRAPDPPGLEGSEVRVFATTSYAVRPTPGIVVPAGYWTLACVSLFILLGMQIRRRSRGRTR